MLLDIIGVISYIFCHLKCALALFFPYHGSARVLASRPLKMNQETSQISHVIFEFEFELLNSRDISGDEQFGSWNFSQLQHLKVS